MYKVGDYEWRQVSMWDFTPSNCIESYVRMGKHVFHHYLIIVTHIVSDKHRKTATVLDIENIPNNIFKGDVFIKRNDKRTRYFYKQKEVENSTIEQIDKVIDLFFTEYEKGNVNKCLYDLAVKLMEELKIERGE